MVRPEAAKRADLRGLAPEPVDGRVASILTVIDWPSASFICDATVRIQISS